MSRMKLWLMSLIVSAWSFGAAAQCGQDGGGCGEGCDGECKEKGPGSCVVDVPTGELSKLTKKDGKRILFLHEEEKLARDVYRHLGRKWDLRPFQNIQRSEQTHVDAMAGLIERYGLTVRSASEDEGVFKNPELRKLYAKLIQDGEASEIAALKVGALVEEVDIEDLDLLLASTKNPDVKQVAESLRFASGNHLRAFVRNLSRRGVEHTPEVLSAQVYAAIVSADTRSGDRD